MEVKDSKSIERDVEMRTINKRAKMGHFIMGLINNSSYVVVISASKQFS